MAIVVESVTQTLVGSNDSTPTFNMPATRPDNNLYLVVSYLDGGGTTTFTGWTRTAPHDSDSTYGSTIGIRANHRIGSSEPASYTGSGPSEEWVFHVYRVSGYDTTTPITATLNVGYQASSGASTAAATAAVNSPDVTGGLPIHSWSVDTDNPTGSAPAGCSGFNGSSSSAGGAGSCYGGTARDDTLTTTSVATSARTMGGTYDDDWGAIAIIVRPAASTGAITLQSVAGVATVKGAGGAADVTIGTPKLNLDTVAGVAAVSNMVVATPGYLTAQSVDGVAVVSNLIVASPAPVVLQQVDGVAALPNVAITVPALLALQSVDGVAALPNVTVWAPSLIFLQSVAGVASLPNVAVASPITVALDAVAGVAAVSNLVVASPAPVTPQAVAGLSSLDNVTILTNSGIIILQGVNGVSALPNVEVETPAGAGGHRRLATLKIGHR